MAALVLVHGVLVNVRVPFNEELHCSFLSLNETSEENLSEDSATILVSGQHLRRWHLERVARHPNA